MESDAAIIKTRLTEDTSKAIRAVLSDVEFNVLRSMQKSRWLNFMGCLACGILGGLLVYVVQNGRVVAKLLTFSTTPTMPRNTGKMRLCDVAKVCRKSKNYCDKLCDSHPLHNFSGKKGRTQNSEKIVH